FLSRKKSDRPMIWARNSMALGTADPGFSDIDLTVFFKNEPKPETLQRLKRLLALDKRTLFPMLGESNVYSNKDFSMIEEIINPWELDRDPTFRTILGNKAEMRRTRGHAAVFLFRMLEADFKNLKSNPHRRIRKWEHHLNAVRNALGGYDDLDFLKDPDQSAISGGILKYILVLIGLTSGTAALDAWGDLSAYLEMQHSAIDVWKISHILKRQPAWWALASAHFSFIVDQPPPLNPALTQTFQAQLEWEAFGVFSQFRLSSSRIEMIRHLEQLSLWLGSVPNQSSLPDVSTDHFQTFFRKLITQMRAMAPDLDALSN
ncbi:MAG: hypothetical protein AABZ55_01990, partial [Bdellovibrionota bacterium]